MLHSALEVGGKKWLFATFLDLQACLVYSQL